MVPAAKDVPRNAGQGWFPPPPLPSLSCAAAAASLLLAAGLPEDPTTTVAKFEPMVLKGLLLPGH